MTTLRLRLDAVARDFDIDDTTTIGRSVSCDIVIADIGVSREHCVVRNTDDAWRIEDLISASGTFVNDEVVSSARELVVDDVIQIGGVTLRVIAT